jgi:hypothetical protein
VTGAITKLELIEHCTIHADDIFIRTRLDGIWITASLSRLSFPAVMRWIDEQCATNYLQTTTTERKEQSHG